MQTFKTDDNQQIHFLNFGSGQPIIFLHGWTASSRDWLKFAAELSDHYEVFCWDARGHGSHAILTESCTIKNMGQDLNRLIQTFELQQPILIGHSMGALTIWEYIRQFGSEHLGGICILDQSPKLMTDESWSEGIYGQFDAQQSAAFLARLEEDFPEAVLELMANGHNQRSRENYQKNSRGFQQMREGLATLNAEALTYCWRTLVAEDYRNVLPTISCKALLIYGRESQFYSENLARWVADQTPLSRLYFYDAADHSPHLWHPELFIYHLDHFIKNQ